jgi:uncharacterized NAD(P)/FAD-binding protein YdhS
MQVDVFEPHCAPGAGPVYDPDQPEFLRMNFAADKLDLWWPSSRAVPAHRRRSFIAWRADEEGGDDEYPPRAQAGRYLRHGFEVLLRSAPENVDVVLHRSAVESVRPWEGGWEVAAGGSIARYDEVLVAVGHQGTSPAGLAKDWSHATPLVPAVFPVGRMLSRADVAPGSAVAIRGFALTFIDAALALTEGRGGTFEPLDHPYRLRYTPGPDDARVLLPFTRSGQPMLAKPSPALAGGVPALAAIAAEGRERIDAIAQSVRLRDDLLPILADVAYASLMAAGGDTASEELAPAAAIERSLAAGAGLMPPGRSWALGHTWRALYPALVARLGDDGLHAPDWPAFLRLAGEMERLAFGPPPVNAAKLLALIDAGRVDLTHLRGGTIMSEGGRTRLRSSGGETTVDVAVDAVLPPPGAFGHAGLLADLVADGHARIAPGRRGLDVAGDATCRALDGSVSRGLAAIGRPTEDSVIGNDTLSRSLHPHADDWARRVALRCRAAGERRAREPAPA